MPPWFKVARLPFRLDLHTKPLSTVLQALTILGLQAAPPSPSSPRLTRRTIKGNTVGTAKLNYHCSYYIDGYYRTMDFYYDITIKSNTIAVTRIEMSPSSATMEIGETLQLTATPYPTNATNRSVNWTTENYSVASVSSSLITARGEGKVWIWARATDGSGAGNYCVVTVNAPTKVSSIELSETEKTLNT